MEINWNPNLRQLRAFGFTSLATLPLAAGVWNRSSTMAGLLTAVLSAAAIGTTLAIIALLRPLVLRPLVVALNVAALPLVIFVHELVLLAAFFGVILPVGLLFRMFRRDALQLKINRGAATYWQPKKQPAGVRSYFRRW